jgi:hypothetical protein
MMKLFVSVLCMVCIGATPALAQMYGWTDEAGRMHYTDNFGTVPRTYRTHVREVVLRISTPRVSSDDKTTSRSLPAPPRTMVQPRAASPDTETVRLLQRQRRELEQQMAAVEQERQKHLSRIIVLRPIRMNPAFGRRRRRSAVWGNDVVSAQQQLDSLYADLQRVQAQLQELEQAQTPTPPAARTPEEVFIDNQGHTATYWQRRLQNLRTRLHSAQEQRQAILEELAFKTQTQKDRRTFGRLGRQIVYQSRALRGVEQDIRETEAALHALRHEAARAEASMAWLE